MLGFLQGLLPRSFAVEQDDYQCIRAVLEKANELAMLGMADEALAMLSVVHAHPSYPGSKHPFTSTGKKFFLHAVKSSQGTQMTEDELHQEQLQAVQTNMYHLKFKIDWDNITAQDYQRLYDDAEEKQRSRFAMSTSGSDAMQLSQTLFGLCYVAKVLGRSEDVKALFDRMARRIHANQQSRFFAMLSFAWPDYLLPGNLRAQLGVDRAQLQDYASTALDTMRSRLENGPVHPHIFYREATMQDLLAKLDEQTQEAPLEEDYEEMDDEGQTVESLPESIVLPGATETEIKETEERLKRPLPQDLKDFYRLSNGTLATSEAADPGWRKRKLLPLRAMFIEHEGYMGDYIFSLLPGLRIHEIDGTDDEQEFWGGIDAPGIAMYEHDGQGTEYTWIFDQPFVEQAKQRVQRLYEKCNAEQRARLDEAIIRVYGTRAAYDEMQYCVCVQFWGEPTSQIFSTFRSYLCDVVYNSKVEADPSPLRPPTD